MATKSPLCDYGGTIEELRAGDTLNGASGGGASVIDIQKFTANGTWTKPTGAKWVEVILWGGGAGGGSGSRQAASTVAGGGAPGAGGGLTFAQIDASLLGATESVTVGATATGGGIVSSDSTSGNQGTAGNFSSIANYRAGGGARGGAAGTSGGSAPSTMTNYYGWVQSLSSANQGGAGSTFPTSQLSNIIFSGSGGGGGSVDGSNNAVRGDAGMDVFGQYVGISLTGGARGTHGGTPTDGSNGTDVTFATQKQIMGASGGGGGGSSATAIAKKGGNGGIPGGGGGGGGGSRNGFASGAGGDGARGEVWVITFF